MSSVTVLDHVRVPGRCGTIEVNQRPIGEALTDIYLSDAHFCAATLPKRPHTRPTIYEIGRTPIEIHVVAFDLDTRGHAPIDPTWCDDLAAKITGLPSAPFAYFTAHGARLVWRLPEPFAIAAPDDATRWRASYLAACDELARFGIVADRSCGDWQRLFRLPHATRTPGGEPEYLRTIGNPFEIGTFKLPDPDLSLHVPAPTRAQRAAGGCMNEADEPRGSLFEVLEAAGLIVGPHDSQSFVIVCPRSANHSTGRPGDGSTVYYVANWFGGSGAVHCKHSSCAHVKTSKQWRRAIAALRAADVEREARP